MKLSAIQLDLDARENGAWVGNLPGLAPEVKFLARGTGNSLAREIEKAQIEKIAIMRDSDRTREAADEMVNDRLMTIVRDWSGIEGEDGTPLPFSEERLGAWLSDPEMAVFRAAVIYAGDVVADRRKSAVEAAGKN